MDIHGQESDEKFMCSVIDRLVPFKVILYKAGIDFDNQSSIFCPFHDDSGHKSAKLYKDKDGERIWCFAEQKMFKPSYVIKQGLIKTRVYLVFSRIWQQLSEDHKELLKTSFGNPISFLPEGWEETVKEMSKFRTGEISIGQFLNIVLSALAP